MDRTTYPELYDVAEKCIDAVARATEAANEAVDARAALSLVVHGLPGAQTFMGKTGMMLAGTDIVIGPIGQNRFTAQRMPGSADMPTAVLEPVEAPDDVEVKGHAGG